MLFVGVSPVHQLNPDNGLANSRFHTLLFGINRSRSDGIPYFGANDPCSAAFVQLLCNRYFGKRPVVTVCTKSE